MPSNATKITPPRVPLVNLQTGEIQREWYRFLLNLFYLTGEGSSSQTLTELQMVRSDLTANYAEAQGSIDALQTTPVAAQIAELQAQIDSLQQQLLSARQPALGSLAEINQHSVPYLGFNTSGDITPEATGSLYWDPVDGNKTLSLVMEDSGGVVQQIGEEVYYRIKASAAITNGEVVMFTGAVGASGVIEAAPASSSLTEGLRIMGVATMDIPIHSFGYVTAFGLVRGFDASGSSVGETWADGDILYYNPTGTGAMTNVRPTSPNEVVIVAAVVHATSGNSGSVFVRPTFYPKLLELSDVRVTAGADKDILWWNAGNSRWENTSPYTILAYANGAPVTKNADFAVADGESWLINDKSGATCTVTLPAASSYSGRVITFQNYQAQLLVSASSNVVPLGGGSAGTAILPATAGAATTLVSDGTNWVIML